MTNIKPATPLPWKRVANGRVLSIPDYGQVTSSDTYPRDAAYIVHACNAYPKLVEALREWLANASLGARYSLQAESRAIHNDEELRIRALLRELKEE